MVKRKWEFPDKDNYQNKIEELRQLAAKDSLSGLLNRAMAEYCIKKRLQNMTDKDICALFIVDLDNFKLVNDTLGHQAGDQAIRQSAKILSGLFHANDIVGRLGGDEFVVFICGKITEELVRKKAAEICEELHLVLGDQDVVSITASVGVYLAERGQEFEGMYQSADLALYKAKKAGKHRFCLKNHENYQDEKKEEFRPINSIPLAGLLENLDSGVALVEISDNPKVIFVSSSFCRIIGTEIQNYSLPMPLEELIHPDDMVLLEQTLREGVRLGKSVESIHRVSAPEKGKWMWWHIRATCVDYDNPNPVMLVTTTDISQFKEYELQLEEKNQRLQVAFDQTSKILWDVDIKTRIFHSYMEDGKINNLENEKIYFPEYLIEGGWIHPNSVSRFRAFARDLLNGQAQGFGNFAIKNKSMGYYSWASISYRAIYDDVGRAVKAVGILDELSQNLYGNEIGEPMNYPLPVGLVADLIVRIQANLYTDTIESLWTEGTNLTGQVQKTRCSRILMMEREKIFCKNDQETYQMLFDRELLINMFESGKRWSSVYYRRIDNSGNIKWVRYVIFLFEDGEQKEIHLFACIIRMDNLHHLEQSIDEEVKRDPDSNLYERESIKIMADKLFSEKSSGNRAVAVLEINGLSKNILGREADIQRIYNDIGTAFSLALGGSCFLGKYSENKLVAVFPSVAGKEDLRRNMEEAFIFIRRIEFGKQPLDNLRFIVGVSLMPKACSDYMSMLDQADQVCGSCNNSSSDTVAFSDDTEEWLLSQIQPCGQNDHISIYSADMDRPMSESEKDVALDCVSTMLNAKTLDASLLGVLGTIGTYYNADRVYSLILVENRNSVIMTFEWTSPNKQSIQQTVSGMRLDRFPLLKRCMDEKAPVFLTRNGEKISKRDEKEKKKEPWRFTVFPLIYDREVGGFLCIENAKDHPSDAALFSTIIPYMIRERQRFGGIERTPGTIEQLMGLPDMRAYMEAIYTINSDRYSSLGVVCLDIPDIGTINSKHGFEYGSKMLWYVVTTLRDLFGSSLLFRTWESEFIIFFPNTTKEVFYGRCGRLHSILQRRYPRQVRVGIAWDDNKFTGKNLVQEAKYMMSLELTKYKDENKDIVQGIYNYLSVGEAAKDGRFMLFFQPKIDMSTEELVGAEALIRAIDDDGNVIKPSQFIELLEKDGSIRELDNFVLNSTLAQIEKWMDRGFGIVPISVNLSRVTLVHPSTLASVLAIQSRYPEIPQGALELEITERGGIDTTELKKIVEKFRSCGLHVSLDDFGSQYANLPIFTNVKFDTVKLDRSLITEITSNPINNMVVKDLLQICQICGISCIAEGVETREQRDILISMGCRYAQGYYYDKPLPAEEFEKKYLIGKSGIRAVVKCEED